MARRAEREKGGKARLQRTASRKLGLSFCAGIRRIGGVVGLRKSDVVSWWSNQGESGGCLRGSRRLRWGIKKRNIV